MCDRDHACTPAPNTGQRQRAAGQVRHERATIRASGSRKNSRLDVTSSSSSSGEHAGEQVRPGRVAADRLPQPHGPPSGLPDVVTEVVRVLGHGHGPEGETDLAQLLLVDLERHVEVLDHQAGRVHIDVRQDLGAVDAGEAGHDGRRVDAQPRSGRTSAPAGRWRRSGCRWPTSRFAGRASASGRARSARSPRRRPPAGSSNIGSAAVK